MLESACTMDTITQISPPVTQADLNKEAVRAQRAEDKAAEYVNAHPHLTMYNGLSLMVTPGRRSMRFLPRHPVS